MKIKQLLNNAFPVLIGVASASSLHMYYSYLQDNNRQTKYQQELNNLKLRQESLNPEFHLLKEK